MAERQQRIALVVAGQRCGLAEMEYARNAVGLERGSLAVLVPGCSQLVALVVLVARFRRIGVVPRSVRVLALEHQLGELSGLVADSPCLANARHQPTQRRQRRGPRRISVWQKIDGN